MLRNTQESPLRRGVLRDQNLAVYKTERRRRGVRTIAIGWRHKKHSGKEATGAGVLSSRTRRALNVETVRASWKKKSDSIQLKETHES